MTTTTNRKVVITEFGESVDVIKIVTEQLAAPAQHEVQVEIIYAGFAGADYNMRRGWYPLQKKAPLTPGYCFVGRVRTNGLGSSKYQPGDVVTALTVYDSDSEAINIPEKYLIPIPRGFDLKKATALTLDWNTAYGMVYRTAKVTKGQSVFIHGLSGAVGYATMMLCKLQGAHVYGTASERNHAALRKLGVEPYVYTDKKWIDAMKKLGGVHAVFDALGYESWDESFSVLTGKERSVLVGYGSNLASLNGEVARSVIPSAIKLLARNLCFWSKKSTTFYYIGRDQSTFKPELTALIKLAEEGTIDVPIKAMWDLDDIKVAHESWGKVEGMGSLIIRVRAE
ncbi:Fc.00g024130.m01.CDS01 [Cosmosporella sp. VM-42]